MTIRFRGARLSGSLPALVLAMALVGPVPAAVIAVVAVPGRCAGRVWNAATYAAIALLGGAALRGVRRR